MNSMNSRIRKSSTPTFVAIAVIALWFATSVDAQPVGMVIEPASGARLLRAGVPNALGTFQRISVGDEIVVESAARVSLLYFANRRRESLTGPARVRIGMDASEVAAGRVDTDVLAGNAPSASELARAGNFRFAHIEASARAISPPLSPAAREELARALTRHEAWRRETAAADPLPDLYVLSVLDKLGQLENMQPYLDRLDAMAGRTSPLAELVLRLRAQSAARTTTTVGVMPFRGDSGEDVGRELATLIENATVPGSRRRRIAPLPADAMQLSSQTTRSAVIRDAARKVSAEYAVFGVMSAPDIIDSAVVRSATECVKTRREGQPGQPVSEQCVEWKPIDIACTRRTAEWRLELSLMEIHSGRTLASDTVRGKASGDGCASLPPPQQAALLREARLDLLTKARELVESKTAGASARFARPDSAIMLPDMQSEFQAALAKAAQGDMGAACSTFRRLALTERGSASASFNAASCEEEAGRYGDALALYRSAESVGGLNQVEVGESVERILALAPDAAVNAATTNVPGTIATSAAAPAATVERRIALVIGNSAYPKAPLRNPVNDARDVARTLSELDFEVIRSENASLEAMNRAIDQFAARAQQFRGVSLIFYAGHGIQVEGENYLIPVDADFKSEREVAYRAVNLGLVLAKVEQAAGRVNILILDACRDNPFARSMRSARRGLASVDAPKGTVIAYATAPGKTAADGDGRNGLYSKHLLREMRAPGARIEDVLKRVGASVAEESRDQQIPWVSSSLTGDFYFKR